MEENIRLARLVATALDNRFSLFGIKFGFNAFLEFIPGLGDSMAAILSLYIIYLALQLRVPQKILVRMMGNIGITFIVGLIPLVGDAFYIFYKPNMRNVELLNAFIKTARVIEA